MLRRHTLIENMDEYPPGRHPSCFSKYLCVCVWGGGMWVVRHIFGSLTMSLSHKFGSIFVNDKDVKLQKNLKKAVLRNR